MTRQPVHAVPIGQAAGHRPDPRCPCGPSQAADLLRPSSLVIVHRHVAPSAGGRTVRGITPGRGGSADPVPEWPVPDPSRPGDQPATEEE
jgi:hypothetical protein